LQVPPTGNRCEGDIPSRIHPNSPGNFADIGDRRRCAPDLAQESGMAVSRREQEDV
jgi:hypothetical protein